MAFRCPLPPDPGYEKTSQFYVSPSLEGPSCGRIRPEAVEIAKMHTIGTVAMLLSSQPHRPIARHRYPVKVDHQRANRQRIREIKLKSIQRQKESSQPENSLPPRTDKYSHVTSKVTAFMTSSPTPGDHNPAVIKPLKPVNNDFRQRNADRDSSKMNPKATLCEDNSSERSTSLRPVVTPNDKKSRNFLAENITKASQCHMKKPQVQIEQKKATDRREARLANHQRGTVPQYLRERQEQWKTEEAERLASLPDPSVPPGHVLMPNHQRIETLQILKNHHKELLVELQSLSVTADTLRVRTRKSELENKLTEIDDALKIFSRPKVYIKLDG